MLESLKSYLIDVGFQINDSEFSKAESAIKQFDSKLAEASKHMSKSLATAATSIIGSLTAINGAIGALVANTAKMDMQYQKLALSLWTTVPAAKNLKTVMDAMGESSMQNIAFIPELRNQFMELSKLGDEMRTPPDASGQLKFIRSIGFEFTKMRLEISYASEWITYYITKYLNKPLHEFRSYLRELNREIIRNMPTISGDISRFLMNFVHLGAGVVRIIKDIIVGIKHMFDMLPSGAKKAVLGMVAAFAIFEAPILGVVAAISGLILLIEDFYGYVDGRKSSKTLAPIWQKIIDVYEKIQGYAPAIKNTLSDIWDSATSLVNRAKDSLIGYWDEYKNSAGANTLLNSLSKAWDKITNAIGLNKLKSYWKSFSESTTAQRILELIDSLFELIVAVIDMASESLGELIDNFSDLFSETLGNGTMQSLVDVFDALLEAVSNIILGVANLIKLFTSMWKEASGSESQRSIWTWFRGVLTFLIKLVAALTKGFLGLFTTIGLAMQGKFKEAARRGKQIFTDFKKDMDKLFAEKTASASGRTGYANGGTNIASQNTESGAPTNQEMLGLANEVSAKTGIPAQFIYGQWAHESANFSSQLARENNNFGGLKNTSGEYMSFSSRQAFADYFAKYIKLYAEDGILDAKTPEEYAAALKHGGYYEDSYENYVAGIKRNMPVVTESAPANVDVASRPSAQSSTGIPSVDESLPPELPPIAGGDENVSGMPFPINRTSYVDEKPVVPVYDASLPALVPIRQNQQQSPLSSDIVLPQPTATLADSAAAYTTNTTYSSPSTSSINVGDIHINQPNATPQQIQQSVLQAVQAASGYTIARQTRDLGGVIL